MTYAGSRWACQASSIPSDGFDFRVADQGFVWSYPDVEGLGELVTDAWRMRAPDTIVGAGP